VRCFAGIAGGDVNVKTKKMEKSMLLAAEQPAWATEWSQQE
jgi:hypothetical protein